MAGTFNYKYKEKYTSKTCVVKYWFGTKYFIWKALHLKQSCEQVFRDLNYKIAKQKLKTLAEDDFFYLVAKYINRVHPAVAIVEVLFESDDHYKILEFDKATLQTAFQDPNCLNICCEQYIPGWLKDSTQNKALQSTKTTPDIQSYAKRVDSKPVKEKTASTAKIETSVTADFDPTQILSKITAAKSKVNG